MAGFLSTVFKSKDGYASAQEYSAPTSKGAGGSSALPSFAGSQAGSAFNMFPSTAPSVANNNVASSQPNIFATIIDHESKGQNINNGSFDATHTASGYFQITDSTWKSTTAGQQSGFTHAMDAPFSTQQQVAGELITKNGLKDWAPYDGIKDSNVSHYDLTPLSGPNGTTTHTQAGAGFSPGAASGSDSVNGADGGMYNPATTPLAITSTGKATNDANTANTKKLTDTSTANTKSFTDTITGTYAAAHAALGDTLFRIALVVIGGILLLGGLWIIAAENGKAPPVGETLKKVGKAAAFAV